MKKQFEATFEIGDIVYIKTDVAQTPGIVTGYRVYIYEVLYEVSKDINNASFYDFELSTDRDIVLSTSN